MTKFQPDLLRRPYDIYEKPKGGLHQPTPHVLRGLSGAIWAFSPTLGALPAENLGLAPDCSLVTATLHLLVKYQAV